MAATIATMATLNAKCFTVRSPVVSKPAASLRPVSLLSLQNLPKGLNAPKSGAAAPATTSLLGTALAGALFSSLSCCDSAAAVQQVAQIAEADNRGLALLLPLIPAILWVLYNILRPALNQLDKMRSEKGVVVGLGLGAGAWAASAGGADAGEIAAIADASASDSRGLLVLFVIVPAVLWVLYNILQPALNQLDRMRSQ